MAITKTPPYGSASVGPAMRQFVPSESASHPYRHTPETERVELPFTTSAAMREAAGAGAGAGSASDRPRMKRWGEGCSRAEGFKRPASDRALESARILAGTNFADVLSILSKIAQ